MDYILYIGGPILGLVLLGAILLRSTFKMSAQTSVRASAEAVHGLVGDLGRWQEWMFPDHEKHGFKFTYSENRTGTGAWFLSESKRDKVKFTVTESDPEMGIKYTVDMKDGAATSAGEIRYSENGDALDVTLSESGRFRSWFARYVAWMLPLMLNPHYRKGFERLKQCVEG